MGVGTKVSKLFEVVFLLKLIYAACRIDNLLASCEEWVAFVANVDFELWFV